MASGKNLYMLRNVFFFPLSSQDAEAERLVWEMKEVSICVLSLSHEMMLFNLRSRMSELKDLMCIRSSGTSSLFTVECL